MTVVKIVMPGHSDKDENKRRALVHVYYYCYYYKTESAVQGRESAERVRTISVRRPQPHTTNPWKEEKDKIVVRDKKERADHVRGKYRLWS